MNGEPSANHNFRRVAIVNRGEPAMRLVHAVRELNRETDSELETIAFYTEPDAEALYVREADHIWNLGSATFIDRTDNGVKSRYLDYDALERALVGSGAEAAWVGWGFVSEHARFAELCNELGIVFIGPSPRAMRRVGDKITSKLLAEEAGVPVAPWSTGPIENEDEARRHAEQLGYPLMLKATAGGGGRGIRKVRSDAELTDVFHGARAEALKFFGDDTVFLEAIVPDARHVEVQIVGDKHGEIWTLGVRDCTLQRRNQKVLEESPSPVLDRETDQRLQESAAALGRAAGYENAGTVEFLYDPTSRGFWFMEVNARLQVEHPVTEITTGIDLVKLQMHVARGGRLEGPPPAISGHAIEVRLNAEDPENGFAPAPGRVDFFRLPTGPGIRIDTGVEEGDSISHEFDSMIAKIIAHGRNRDEAMARLGRALAETAVVVNGGTTNKAFLTELLARPETRTGDYDVRSLDRLMVEGGTLTTDTAVIALLQAAVEVYDKSVDVDRTRFYSTAFHGRPELGDDANGGFELSYRGCGYALKISRLSPRDYEVEVDGHRVRLAVDRIAHYDRRLTVRSRTYRVFTVAQGRDHLIEVDGIPYRISGDDGGTVRAPSPAVVVSLDVAEGESFEAGQRLAVLEAMKMEIAITADSPGRVRRILVRRNVQVPTGAALMRVERSDAVSETSDQERVSFDEVQLEPTPDGLERCRQNLSDLKHLILGYDVERSAVDRIVAELGAFCQPDDPELMRQEESILDTFVAAISLFRRQAAAQELGEDMRHSSEDYLYSYLHDLGAKGEGLPEWFLENLRLALAHYGVKSLERTAELEESLYRIYRAHFSMGSVVPALLKLLERRLSNVDLLTEHAGEDFQGLLDRLVGEARGRFPAVHDLAREVRYRYYDQPLLEESRRHILAGALADLEDLKRQPEAEERTRLIASLVECPQPLKGVLSSHYLDVDPELRCTILEVMMRRYYRIRDLREVKTFSHRGHCFATARYEFEGRSYGVLTIYSRSEKLSRAARAVRRELGNQPDDLRMLVDLYIEHDGPLDEPDQTSRAVLEALAPVLKHHRPERVVAAISSPQAGSGMGDMYHFTYREADGVYLEDTTYRNLHPMIGKRLRIELFDAFDIERLPSSEDVYLFRAVARENRRDERLMALAEVRDLTAVRDGSGQILKLPELERTFMEALAGIRRFQARRPHRRRLQWNRVYLHVWPVMEIGRAELGDLVRRLAPAAEGLGLEKVQVHARVADGEDGKASARLFEVRNPGGQRVTLRQRSPLDRPLAPLTEYTRKVVAMRLRGMVYPYELIRMLAPDRELGQTDIPHGDFQEYDLDDQQVLAPVDRPAGGNTANIVVGTIRNFTGKHPEGMSRVLLASDPSRGMGSLAEAECRRILAALDLAEEQQIPLEWFAVSAGARISMESGTENMDWIARVLRRLVQFTQDGGEVNVVAAGINVGAQPYWNAEATMLMHTRGVLIMTGGGAMVLTGKRALDFSGGVSAGNNFGIGGYEHIMGPNGQAQYYARDAGEACQILLRHYEHSYVAPGERFPRAISTSDPADRDVRLFPHGGEFNTVGEVFSAELNPDRKRPFQIRRVMAATIDQDHVPLERWFGMQDAEVAIVWDAHLGGQPVCLVGLESRPLARFGFVPADGPAQWTAGTLFPRSSKKVARAINSSSGNRPLVVLANLSGFDGSPESMRMWQLEYGAEIGRAVVNFRGPIVFCVVSRYHGGAFVVFSNALNESMEVAALEGSFASVIGGAPAAAVVFTREVSAATRSDQRVLDLQSRLAAAEAGDRGRLSAQLEELIEEVRIEKMGAMARTFNRVHSVERALEVGSIHRIIPPLELRPYLIDAVQRGMRRTLQKVSPELAAAGDAT